MRVQNTNFEALSIDPGSPTALHKLSRADSTAGCYDESPTRKQSQQLHLHLMEKLNLSDAQSQLESFPAEQFQYENEDSKDDDDRSHASDKSKVSSLAKSKSISKKKYLNLGISSGLGIGAAT